MDERVVSSFSKSLSLLMSVINTLGLLAVMDLHVDTRGWREGPAMKNTGCSPEDSGSSPALTRVNNHL